jgi:tetratricopeptide (TPR) repeat protein
MPKSKTTAEQNTVKTYEKALQLMNQKKYDKASQHLSEVVEKCTDNDRLVARAKSQIKTCQAQIQRTQKAAVEPSESYDMAVFQHNTGNYDEALELFSVALKHSEKKDHIYLSMAATEACLGNTEKAVENLKESILIDDTNRILAQNDPELESLSEDPGAAELLQSP